MAALNQRNKFPVMASPFSKDLFTSSKHPRLVSPVVVPLGLFIMFITWYFWISLSCPVGSAVPSRFCGTAYVGGLDSLASPREGGRAGKVDYDKDLKVDSREPEVVDENKSEAVDEKKSEVADNKESEVVAEKKSEVVEYQDTTGPGQQVNSSDETLLPSDVWFREQATENSVSSENRDSEDNGADEAAFVADFRDSEVSPGTTSSETSADSDCDLYHGQWYYDPTGPLYTNNSCPILTQSQNCQGNGRPDKEYENWRWKPLQCELPRFNASKFLELMSGKTITFVGDSVARNQMESLMCLLWQVETPQNRGSRRMQRWYFRSHSVTIIRVWSAWLVHHTTESFSYVPEGVTKLHLDVPDENVMELIPRSDVVVLCNGHWFTKASAFLLRNEIVGTQLWSSPDHQQMNFTNMEAYRISTETILTALATHQNYSGLTILVSYSPDHYENGAWNTGGSCTGKVRPLSPGQLVEPGYTYIMHEKQLTGFDQAIKKKTNQSKLKLMDITEAFGYRHDGHPGPYRSLDPNKVTKRGPNGRPPSQDCLHWCMPGPIDTWNDLMLETIRREFRR